MLTQNQFISLKNIYSLLTNITDYAYAWSEGLNINDSTDDHIAKLSIIMDLISGYSSSIEGELDDILIIVEENLKEYILEKYAKESEDDTANESENETT
jgi:hypothetical protein